MRLNIYLLLFLLCCGLNAFSQSNSIRFSQLSIKEGLSQSSVNQVFQDSKGYMWFATQDGLNKFDGYKFTVYKNDPLDSSSISDNFIHVVYEDKNGDMWIGTDEGLNFFDRETQRFRKFIHTNAPGSISHNSVWGITRDKKGNLWIATAEGGLNRLDTSNGRISFKTFKQGNNGLSSNYLSSLYCDSKGNLWIGTLGGGVSVLSEDGKFTVYRNDNNDKNSLADDIIWSFFEDSKKNIWIGTNEGLSKFDPSSKRFKNYLNDPRDPYSLSGNVIRSVSEDPDGNIWIGTAGGGLNRLDVKGNFTWYKNLSYNSSSLVGNTVYSILRDNTGVIWIGTDNGLSRFDYFKQNFSHYQYISSNEKGISSNMIWSILSNKDQTLWLGTDNGLCLLNRRTQQYKEYGGIANTTEGENKRIYSLHRGSDGLLWVGTDKGLYYLAEPGKKLIKAKSSDQKSNALNDKRIYCIYEDTDRNIWIGSKEGLLVLDARRKAFHSFRNDENDETSVSNNVIRVIKQDKKGTIWIGTNGGGLNKVQFEKPGIISAENISFTDYKNTGRKSNSINNNIILSIYEDGDILWLGTYGGGLNKFDPATGKATHFTDRDGLSNNVIYSIVPDNKGSLWMSTNRGISRFDVKNKSFRNYYENDGLQSNEFNIGAYHRSEDGEIFMGGINGLNAFLPEKIQTNPLAPSVAITDFLIFNKSIRTSNSFLKKDVSFTKHIKLNYKQNSFSFEFSALHFSAPEKNSYAYMLEGLEDSWNFVDSRHLATYTKLDPGTYVFKLKAANSDKVWSEPVEVTITITPPFWATWWFRIAVALLLLATVYSWYKARIRNIEEQKKVLEQLVSIRTAEIQHHMEEVEVQKALVEKEKEKVERLLLNILPEDTAEELKTKGKAEARHYRLASVMFTDFKGFTQIAETMRPKDLVAELDRYFIQFDRIIERYGIEKIKTIGDSYMCAGGLPIRNKSNPIDIILAALEIQRFMREDIEAKKSKGETFWELRIGIHTGELIAGVVGTKRFAYDIWGDTVNVANRMESSGIEGKVNISGTTYELASEFFVCTFRGKVEAKNKGEIDMYFVERIRPELSENGEGLVPNEVFQRKMSHVLYSKIQYKKAEQYILKLLSEKLPEGLFYHGLHHTMDVCDAVEKLAFLEGIEGEDVFLLKTAALFHDAGFTKEYAANEIIGVEMSKEILPQFGYSEKQVEIIEGLILATRVPQKPETHLQQIICDADLDYLGRDDFHRIADTLRQELTAFGKINNMKQWDEIQVKFLEAHKYFTNASKTHRAPKKAIHVEEVKQRLAADLYETDRSAVKE